MILKIARRCDRRKYTLRPVIHSGRQRAAGIFPEDPRGPLPGCFGLWEWDPLGALPSGPKSLGAPSQALTSCRSSRCFLQPLSSLRTLIPRTVTTPAYSAVLRLPTMEFR